MKKNVFITSLVLIVIVLAISCAQNKTPENKAEPTAITPDSLVKKGQYLVTAMGCTDCHTPKKMGPQGPEPDPDLFLSGHPSKMPVGKIDTMVTKNWLLFNYNLTAFVGPWGVSFSANLTSDESGIGNWTEEQFFTAIRKGKFKGLEGGRPLLPPMPWQQYRNLNDEDLKAVFMYLKSTKPIANVVPGPIPPDMVGKN